MLKLKERQTSIAHGLCLYFFMLHLTWIDEPLVEEMVEFKNVLRSELSEELPLSFLCLESSSKLSSTWCDHLELGLVVFDSSFDILYFDGVIFDLWLELVPLSLTLYLEYSLSLKFFYFNTWSLQEGCVLLLSGIPVGRILKNLLDRVLQLH
ncbi:hypothetical protein Tco_0811568 [Tanacetum coccineum]